MIRETTRVTAGTFYGADDLTHLEGLEAVRKRPGMYIGSTDSRGINHLFNEIVDNSTDEGIAWPRHQGRRHPARRRQRPGRRRRPWHPHRRAHQVRIVRRRAGAHPAARRRQVRRLRLQDLRRSARRRRLGGQRAVAPLRRHGQAGRQGPPDVLRARRAGRVRRSGAQGQVHEAVRPAGHGQDEARRVHRHVHPLLARPALLREHGARSTSRPSGPSCATPRSSFPASPTSCATPPRARSTRRPSTTPTACPTWWSS